MEQYRDAGLGTDPLQGALEVRGCTSQKGVEIQTPLREASAGLTSNGDSSYTVTIILSGNSLAERFGIISRKLHLTKALKLLKMEKPEMQQKGQNS